MWAGCDVDSDVALEATSRVSTSPRAAVCGRAMVPAGRAGAELAAC